MYLTQPQCLSDANACGARDRPGSLRQLEQLPDPQAVRIGYVVRAEECGDADAVLRGNVAQLVSALDDIRAGRRGGAGTRRPGRLPPLGPPATSERRALEGAIAAASEQ